jgi:spermidine synthase
LAAIANSLKRQALPICILVFFSGFVALVYQVLWVKDLSLLFGNTAQAAATTLAVFFLGLAAGGHVWGRRSAQLRNPLRAYAWLESCIGVFALPFLLLLPVYKAAYEPLYLLLGESPELLTAAKLALAAVVLFPPAFFMGGTFPLLAQHAIPDPEETGRDGSFLYGVNTLGAALGALIAGFYLPRAIGFEWSYKLAAGGNVLIGLAAFALAGRTMAASPASPVSRSAAATSPGNDHRRALDPTNGSLPSTLAFLSGFLVLGLEVLWTRMLSQVLQNSVYTFSVILVTFLVSLTFGALLANRLCRMRLHHETVLCILTLLAGLSIALTPFLFMHFMEGGRYLGSDQGWMGYVTTTFLRAGFVLVPPGLFIGSVFPYLLRFGQRAGSAGEVIGRLTALNTVGSVAGSIAVGFFLLPHAGLWETTRLFGLGYLLLALWLAAAVPRRAFVLRGLPVCAGLLLFALLDPTRLPLLRLGPEDRVLETWQAAHGTVAVVARPGNLLLSFNNHYRLGGSASRMHEERQAVLPLLTHPDPQDVFLLGMGTGITAGAALRFPVRSVVVAELVPEVVDASAEYFHPFTGGLFTDPRVEILRVDGRNHLLGSARRYDVILGDLFLPWEAGAGSLYSLEHFRSVKRRLKTGGVFVQWLPLYQVSQTEFETIARTLLEVFPEVVLWRGEFNPERPTVALAASATRGLLDPAALAARGKALPANASLSAAAIEAAYLPFYAGNLGRSRHVLPAGPINTDDRPVIEYAAPVAQRNVLAGSDNWFTGTALMRFFDQLAEAMPPREDPYLANLDAVEVGYVEAGLSYFKRNVANRLGDAAGEQKHLAAYHARIPAAFRSHAAASISE